MGSIAGQDAVAIVERQLQQRRRHFTLTEAAALTGLSIDAAREALEALLTRYVCRLQVSENGDLIYNFGETLRRRGSKTAAERLEALGTWLWKGFTIVYKAWITLTLVVYFVIFLALLLILVIAASSRDSSNRRRSSSLNLWPFLYMFTSLFRWRTATGTITYEQDRYGYRYRHYQPEPGILKANRKNFVAAVYDFVFGPPRAARDPLENEKEVAAYLWQHKGVLVTAELSALAGLTFPQAEAFLTDCIIRYHGDSKVSEQAVLYTEFDTITRRVGAGEADRIVHYWDEYEPEYELTGNSAAHNLLIGFMNGFNLLFAVLVLSGSLVRLLPMDQSSAFATAAYGVVSSQVGMVVLGWLPLMFSMLFFAIPLARLIRLQALRQQRHFENIRKRLFKAIFTRQGQPQTLRDVVTAVNANAPEETLAPPVVEDMMQTLALDLEGDMAVTDAAEVQFAFPRIRRELQEVERLRRHRQVDQTLGKIIAESDNV